MNEISVDSVDTRLPEEYRALYKDRMEELRQIGAECINQGSVHIMKIVEANTPLARYRRDLAKTTFGLTPGFLGTKLVSIPTKIPNVDFRCIYPRGIDIPQVSLIVKPFS